MNREEFLKELKARLAKLPSTERDDIVRDIEEYFREGKERGRAEESLIKKLGSPKSIADASIAECKVRRIENATSIWQKLSAMLGAMFAILLLTPFNLIFVLVPLLIVTFFVALGWPLVFVLALTIPFVIIMNTILMFSVGFNIFALLSIVCFMIGWTALAIGAVICMLYLTMLYFKGVAGLFQWNVNIVKNRMRTE